MPSGKVLAWLDALIPTPRHHSGYRSIHPTSYAQYQRACQVCSSNFRFGLALRHEMVLVGMLSRILRFFGLLSQKQDFRKRYILILQMLFGILPSFLHGEGFLARSICQKRQATTSGYHLPPPRRCSYSLPFWDS